MQWRACVDYWGDGVGCFCHEAVARAVLVEFPDAAFDYSDLAHAKYLRVADQPLLCESAWREFLRNGPRYRFTAPCGITGVISRYEVSIELDDRPDSANAEAIRRFMSKLNLGQIVVHEVV